MSWSRWFQSKFEFCMLMFEGVHAFDLYVLRMCREELIALQAELSKVREEAGGPAKQV